MDMDQLTKRVQWMEDERRKERDAVALLENRYLEIEGSLKALSDQMRELTGELNRQAAILKRMDAFDASLAQLRAENRQWVDESEKEIRRQAEEAEKVRMVEMKALESAIAELRKELETLARLDKTMQARQEEELRLRRMIEEVQQQIESLKRDEEETMRIYRLLEDGRRQDSKRIIDLQGEVVALRKRADDLRGQNELQGANLRKLETRLNELVAVEAERREAVASFLDKQAVTQVERDRIWKEWEARFAMIEQQALDVQAKLLTLDAAQREAKRIQGVLEELTGRVDRRLNEILEIQRLAEERFRQEWATFKADDQKRWTNYTLTQDEQQHEFSRQLRHLDDRAAQIEDTLQELTVIVDQTNVEMNKRLQSLLSLIHDWATSMEKMALRTR